MYNVKVLMDVKDLLEKYLTPKEILSLRTPEGRKRHHAILKDIYHDCCMPPSGKLTMTANCAAWLTHMRITGRNLQKWKRKMDMGSVQ